MCDGDGDDDAHDVKIVALFGEKSFKEEQLTLVGELSNNAYVFSHLTLTFVY
jgi:hypothetical protein